MYHKALTKYIEVPRMVPGSAKNAFLACMKPWVREITRRLVNMFCMWKTWVRSLACQGMNPRIP